ncbi:hypothetical protein CDL15_Pgr009264 [Punica granatum]|uniref:Uncharacterized protein n=1 Tax=Punica granatum TaxID=22663 RepID=A0A218WW23_PUNGR|nr:hypothetical protein CDL15_Pgr009264 [Punica granatum]
MSNHPSGEAGFRQIKYTTAPGVNQASIKHNCPSSKVDLQQKHDCPSGEAGFPQSDRQQL